MLDLDLDLDIVMLASRQNTVAKALTDRFVSPWLLTDRRMVYFIQLVCLSSIVLLSRIVIVLSTQRQ